MKFTFQECSDWLQDRSRNPRTGRHIRHDAKNSVYTQFERCCKKYGLLEKKRKAITKKVKRDDHTHDSISKLPTQILNFCTYNSLFLLDFVLWDMRNPPFATKKNQHKDIDVIDDQQTPKHAVVLVPTEVIYRYRWRTLHHEEELNEKTLNAKLFESFVYDVNDHWHTWYTRDNRLIKVETIPYVPCKHIVFLLPTLGTYKSPLQNQTYHALTFDIDVKIQEFLTCLHEFVTTRLAGIDDDDEYFEFKGICRIPLKDHCCFIEKSNFMFESDSPLALQDLRSRWDVRIWKLQSTHDFAKNHEDCHLD